ncbi:hypothetical protein D3C84_800510 [compost metagenome]
MLRIPLCALIAMTAIVPNATTAEREPMPPPNHKFIMGASATIGTAFKAAASTMPGAPHFGHAVATSATANPAAAPASRPITASVSVYTA